jgi:hypothetical protein
VGIRSPFLLKKAELKKRLEMCEERCRYFQQHGHRYRRQHLQRRLSIAKRNGNKTAEHKILDIIKRERERAFWRRLNYSMKKNKGRSVRVVQVEMEDGTVREASSKTDVERSIWKEIHGQRFYLAEQAPICQGGLRGEFGYMANTPAAKAVLEGKYQFPEDCDIGTRDLLNEAAAIREIIPEGSVDTMIRSDAWIDKWTHTDEATSSSKSGRHFGHYISGTKSEYINHHHALKSSICLKRGFALERWSSGLSCMLEKKAGCRLLSKLRSILLMEGDFNANNKLIYGVRMMDNVRRYGLMEEEIYSEQGKTAEDGALAKVLFYDIVRWCRLCASISCVDASNCYDSIAHAIASIIFQACGVPVEGVQAMLEAIQEMKYFLRTAFGDSTAFANSKIEIKYQGLCQGNGAAPAGWAVISIAIIRAHKKRGHAATFVCPMTSTITKLASILYVDDNDLVHIDMNADDSAFITFQQTYESIKSWGQLLIASGGAYKPPKCFYHLISFGFKANGNWFYEDNHELEEYNMVVLMPDGNEWPIEHLPVTTPKETLGVWTCPTGDPAGAIAAMTSKAQEWVDKAKECSLKRRDVWFLLDRQFWPRAGYGICCLSAEHTLLEKCLSKQYFEILPMGGVIRTAPAPVRTLGKGFYGVGCPHVGVECTIQQVSKLLMHYGCESNVGTKMKMSYNQLVIELGLSDQPMQHSFQRFGKFVTWSWIVSLWEKCDLYDITVEVNDVPICLPRERDKWLMQELKALGFTDEELKRLGKVRLYQQVLFLSDIIGVTGRSLDERYLKKRPANEQWSTLIFPKEAPPAKDFRLWQQALRQLVPAGGLRVHLGRFLHEGYKKWEWRANVAEKYLLHYVRGGMDIYEPSNETARKWIRTHEGCEAEMLGLPCAVRDGGVNNVKLITVGGEPDPVSLPESFMDVLREWGNTWMWKSLRLVGDDDWLIDAIREGTCVAVTDGSYIRELYPELCSCAFVLECTKGRGRIFGSFPEQSKQACAYRGKLLGLMAIHLILLAINKVCPELPGHVQIYSDCLGALKRVSTLPGNRLPSGCKHSDILKNIMINCSKLSFDCEYLHVIAHQDDGMSYHKLQRPSQLNCLMDTNAKNVIWGLEGEELPPQDVFPLEPVAVFVGSEKLTSGSEDYIRFWCQRIIARQVFAHKKVRVLTPNQFDEVHWESVYQALSEVPRLFALWACKQVMGIAGTNEMQSKYTPNHDKKCPSCGICDETCGHVLWCNEEGRVETLHASIDLVDRWLQDHGTDGRLRRYLMEYAHGRGGLSMVDIVRERQEAYRRLAESMDEIGWRRFMEGMISKEVIAIQRKAIVEEASRLTLEKWSSGLVTRLLEATHGQWLYRNVQVHDFVSEDIATKRKDEIRRELENLIELGGEGLEEEDLYLLEINLDDLETTSGELHAYWLLALRAARAAKQLRDEINSNSADIEEEH